MNFIPLYEEIIRRTEDDSSRKDMFWEINCRYLLENCGRLALKRDKINSAKNLLIAIEELLKNDNYKEQISIMNTEKDIILKHWGMYMEMSDSVKNNVREYLYRRIDRALNSKETMSCLNDIFEKIMKNNF